ncbi:hypothetical protein BO71DRAFT_353339 [Aspergillus ellipticus CBS 707.79]|uniref:HCNGP-domain-containing protein n=1 Tax=Aspergillus ellipticus CBS 707.79 TaxID=1448320 RepID=A0A319DB37_9EURO|nr:hypothetical protein BO71DRAFT_353339 [Aspergillus ellipticus CBS 707.79]
MLGLGAYESSSEDEREHETPSTSSTESKRKSEGSPSQGSQKIEDIGPINQHSPSEKMTAESDQPVFGPTHQRSPVSQDGHPLAFSTSRTLIHDLTLPPLPNLDIPPSPPGSPDRAASAKFSHFLSLKKQGMHFNEKLAGSTSLKNPSLMRKMMDHAGIDGQTQYHTSLPVETWNASSNLPNWGFKDELLKVQRDIHNKVEDMRSKDQRDPIKFVAASPGESTF